MFALKADVARRASPARLQRPSVTGCSTSRPRPKASAATCSRSSQPISERSSAWFWPSAIRLLRIPRACQNALAAASKLEGAYERAYYSGIVWERRAKAVNDENARGLHHTVYEWVVKALGCFDEAGELRPPDNDDALLRWNTCVRFLARNPNLAPRSDEAPEPIISE